MRLSPRARALPESLRMLARYGAGPTPETVTLTKVQLEGLADAAQELDDLVQELIDAAEEP